MSSDKRKELAEIVAKAKQEAEQKQLAELNKSVLSPKQQGQQARELLTASITRSGIFALLPLAVTLGLLIANLYVHYLFRRHLPKNYFLPLGLLVPTLVLVGPVFNAVRRLGSAFRLLRLRRICRYPWNREQFLEQLSELRSMGTLTLHCFFATECDTGTQKLFLETVGMLCDEKTTAAFAIRKNELSGRDELCLTIEYTAAGIVRTKGSRYSTGRRFFSNHRYYEKFDDIVSRVLPKIAAVSPIAAIDAHINGSVLRGDASILVETVHMSGEWD